MIQVRFLSGVQHQNLEVKKKFCYICKEKTFWIFKMKTNFAQQIREYLATATDEDLRRDKELMSKYVSINPTVKEYFSSFSVSSDGRITPKENECQVAVNNIPELWY